MNNRILDVQLEDRSLDPVAAEIGITIRPKHLTPATEVRGRLMGPSCPYSSTVEIAYPLTALKRGDPAETEVLRSRVVIPEASLWDPQSPFLYAGPVELWQDGQCLDRMQVRHGLRKFSLGSRGLRVNAQLLALEGRLVESLTEKEALQLRAQGCNLLLTPLREDTLGVWDRGDRFGFVVLALADLANARTRELFELVSRRTCYLGWTLSDDDILGLTGSELLRGDEMALEGVGLLLQREGEGFILRANGVVLGRILQMTT
jgi:hypothetical protein